MKLFNVPRLMIVAPTVIMMPGIYAFEMIVLFNRGQVLDALQASGDTPDAARRSALG